ncbi:MerR family transcriptional regulator [Pseudonocardia sulfidoxydans NBRC 16205]|uniref:MerR family transcriptional regulator n=1 Tax=Pseudonocardia sulfidoxydans NBRC 16205 TaxID=1223511 RepID=A0A511DDE3_9PSEU|nr:MerR family transcriptional regulator [Pseudonocardia sulfidoxydans]GEL22830.1 MerR family transcriptional regulator [Pseudonocardia sulfidoxydans NBRC 16205]
MRIGELARLADVTTRTLRHYDELGLLTGRRGANGYRVYDDADLRAIREIRMLVGLGFALEDTRPFVECLRAGHERAASCPDSIAVLRRRIAEVDDSVDRLQEVRGELTRQLGEASRARCEFSGIDP